MANMQLLTCICSLLIRCGVAHWAAGGGHDDVCKWLHDACGVDFTLRNFKGSTPLSKAVAHGQGKLAQCKRSEGVATGGGGGGVALRL